MNILIMGNALRPDRAGAPVTGYNVATHDSIAGLLRYVDSETYCLVGNGDYQREAIDKIIAKMPHRRQNHIHVINEYDVLFNGQEALGNPDILHSVKEDPIPLISARSHLRKNAPLTFVFHGLAEQHVLTDTVYPLFFLPFQPYDAVLCSSSAVINTIHRMLDRLEDIGGKLFSGNELRPPRIRLEKVPLGIDTDYFKPFPKEEARAAFNLPRNAVIILWFGRFSQIFKADLFPLLHVFQMLRKATTQKIHLVLAGSEDRGSHEMDDIKQLADDLGIGDAVSIIENQDIVSRPMLYSAADIFTSPIDNLQETFGLTPVEAMACGVPQVVSDWDGYRDTVKNDETGYRIPTIWADCMDDVASADYLPTNIAHRRMLFRSLSVRSTVVDTAEYYKRLLLLIERPDVRRRMAETSRKCAISNYDLRVNASCTEAIWRELSDIAQHSGSDLLDRNVPMVNYCNDFYDYPTRFIDKATVFQITEFGRSCPPELIDRNQLFSHYVPEAKLTRSLLEYVKSTMFVDVATACQQFPNFKVSQIIRSIMCLYKYDYLRPVLK